MSGELKRLQVLVDRVLDEDLADWCCSDCFDGWLSDDNDDNRPAMRALHRHVMKGKP